MGVDFGLSEIEFIYIFSCIMMTRIIIIFLIRQCDVDFIVFFYKVLHDFFKMGSDKFAKRTVSDFRSDKGNFTQFPILHGKGEAYQGSLSIAFINICIFVCFKQERIAV